MLSPRAQGARVSPARGSLAARAASYAAATMIGLASIQYFILRPNGPLGMAILILPCFVCTTMTYLITRQIARRRAAALTEVYLRFKRGDLDDDLPFPADPEFRGARELFMRLGRELHRATRELEQRDAERRRLFSDVVHELGTPVSSLLGLAEAFVRPHLVATVEQRDKLARAMLHESERVAVFIDDLRDLAQLDDPAMVLSREPVELDVIARHVVERLNAIPNVTTVEVITEPAHTFADPIRIEQVLVNLITNARRYAQPPAPILVRVEAADGRARLAVEDGGPGVAEADLPKLGERLRRLDQSRSRNSGGTGLGLSIVTAITRKHDGSVRYRRSAGSRSRSSSRATALHPLPDAAIRSASRSARSSAQRRLQCVVDDRAHAGHDARELRSIVRARLSAVRLLRRRRRRCAFRGGFFCFVRLFLFLRDFTVAVGVGGIGDLRRGDRLRLRPAFRATGATAWRRSATGRGSATWRRSVRSSAAGWRRQRRQIAALSSALELRRQVAQDFLVLCSRRRIGRRGQLVRDRRHDLLELRRIARLKLFELAQELRGTGNRRRIVSN